jgi:hypothetical protein
LLEQLRADPDRELLARLLGAWAMEFGDRQVTVREVISRIQQDINGDLHEALMDLPVLAGSSVNSNKLGWYLRKNADRPVDGCKLIRDPTSERTAWRVELSGERAEQVATTAAASRVAQPDPEDKF